MLKEADASALSGETANLCKRLQQYIIFHFLEERTSHLPSGRWLALTCTYAVLLPMTTFVRNVSRQHADTGKTKWASP